MLDIAARFVSPWHIHFNTNTCDVLLVGQKRRGKRWRLGNDKIKEVDEYQYFGVKQAGNRV